MSSPYAKPLGPTRGRQQHVDPAARAKVEHGLPRLELGDRGRVPAADAGERCTIGQLAEIVVICSPPVRPVRSAHDRPNRPLGLPPRSIAHLAVHVLWSVLISSPFVSVLQRWAARQRFPLVGGWRTTHHEFSCGREAAEAVLVDPPQARCALAVDEEEARVPEDLQVVRHGRLTDVDGVDDLGHAHRALRRGQQVEDHDPGRVTQRLEPGCPCLGGVTINVHLSSTIVDECEQSNARRADRSVHGAPPRPPYPTTPPPILRLLLCVPPPPSLPLLPSSPPPSPLPPRPAAPTTDTARRDKSRRAGAHRPQGRRMAPFRRRPRRHRSRGSDVVDAAERHGRDPARLQLVVRADPKDRRVHSPPTEPSPGAVGK